MQISVPQTVYLPEWKQSNDYATGVFYSRVPPGGVISHGTAIANGVMGLIPFIPRFTHTFQTIGFYNSSAAQTGRKFRMGIYASANGQPTGAPLVDGGETTLGAAAGYSEKTVSLQLLRGVMYYLALNTDGALTGEIITPTSGYLPNTELGVISVATMAATNATAVSYGYTMASAYGALPTIGTIIDAGVATNPPLLWLKG